MTKKNVASFLESNYKTEIIIHFTEFSISFLDLFCLNEYVTIVFFYSEFPKKKKVICKPIFQIKINFTDVIENKKISSSFSIQREWSKK